MPIQINSLCSTVLPHSLKKLAIPIGETFISLQGKKYHELSNGEKNATPKPPSVSASKILCEAVQSVKNNISHPF